MLPLMARAVAQNVAVAKKGKVPITVLLACFLGFAVVLPIGILILQSLMLKLGDFSLSNLTLHYWIGQGVKEIFNSEPGVLVNPQFYQVLKNSLKLVVIASFIATIFGQLIGYVNSRGRHLKSGKLVEQLVFIPYLIPSIAFGAMYLSMFSTAKTVTLFGHTLTVLPSLYGTFALLVLVTVVKNLPFSSRAGTANMLQISVELEEAAHISGAHFLTRFRKIVFPLSKNGFMSGFHADLHGHYEGIGFAGHSDLTHDSNHAIYGLFLYVGRYGAVFQRSGHSDVLGGIPDLLDCQ